MAEEIRSLGIGIGGKLRSGKSTLASALATVGFRRYAFAAKLKEICELQASYLRGAPRGPTLAWHVHEVLSGGEQQEVKARALILEAFERLQPVPGAAKNRALLQYVGTEVIRGTEVDAWVNYLLRQVDSDGAERPVIDDMRFMNEFDALRARGFFLVRCVAPPAVVRMRRYDAECTCGQPLPEDEDQHASECDLDALPPGAWDYVWDSSRSLSTLRSRVFDLLVAFTAARLPSFPEE